MKNAWKLFRDALRGTSEDLTAIPLNRAIILLAVPTILEMAMEGLFAIVDAYFVGKVSTEAAATIGMTEAVMTIIFSLGIGLSIAATAMVSRRVGEKNHEGAAVAAAQAIWIVLGLSLTIAIPGMIYSADILRLMGAEETVISEGSGYTKIMFATNAVIMLLFLLNGVFRGAGNATMAMQSLWVSNGINIVLDPCFIFGLGPFPEMGVEGAAIATSIGRGLGVCFQLYFLFKGTTVVKLKMRHFALQADIIRRLIDVGSKGAGQFLISSASWIFLMRIIALFGKEVVAGYTFAVRVIIFAILPAWGMANAAGALVGQNLGAKKPDQAEQAVWRSARFTTVYLFLISVVFFIFAPEVLGIFSPDPIVVGYGVDCLRIVCVGYFTFGYGMILSQAQNGAGDTGTPTLVNFVCFWLLQIPIAYLSAVYFEGGPNAIYWTVVGVYAVFALIFIYLFRLGKWKEVEI